MIDFISNLLLKLTFWKYKKRGVVFGNNVYISPKAYIDSHPGSKVVIGNNVYITRNVVILNHTDTHKGGPVNAWVPYGGKRFSKDVIIEDNVFIGVNSVVMPGVTIGKNAIVGALSFVVSDVPPGTVYAGVPAKKITTVEEMIKKDIPDFDITNWKKDFF